MPKPSPITKDRFFEGMIFACPSFEGNWLRFLDEWKGNPILVENGADGTLPHYLLLSELANHLIRFLEVGETSDFPEIFAVIEDWIIYGDQYVGEAAVVGLLEDLTAEHRYRTAEPSDFLTWLGPTSKKWWFEVIDFHARIEAGNFRPLSID